MYISRYIDKKFVKFAEMLPHGSGIDSDWNAYETNNNVYFTNSFHCMDDNGLYCGWQDFTIRINQSLFNLWVEEMNNTNRLHVASRNQAQERIKILQSIISEKFSLHFNNGQYLANKHFLRDYLEDTISYHITK